MADKTRREKKFDKKSYAKQLQYLRGLDNPQRIRFLQRIPDTATRERLASEIPGFQEWWDANRNMPGGGREGGLGHKSTSGNYNIPTQKKEQRVLQDLAIEQFQKGLPELLERLRTPYTSPIRSQMEEMFGHLQNPILQGLINPQAQNQARGALFPSEIEQEYMMSPQYQESQQGPLGNLLGVLGGHLFNQHAVPYFNNLKPEDIQAAYGYAEPLINRASEGLGNAYHGAQNAYQGAQNLGRFAKTLPGEAYNDISSLLGSLTGGIQNYADVGYGEIRNPQNYRESIQQVLGTLMQPVVHPLNFMQGARDIGSNLFNRKGK